MMSFLRKIDEMMDGVWALARDENLPWLLIVIATILVNFKVLGILFDYTYFTDAPHTATRIFEKPAYTNMIVYAHVLCSYPALMIGPWTFNSRLRKTRIGLHRTLGKIYVVACLLGAITAFPVAMYNSGGPVAMLGFGCMATLWFIITFLAYTAIINKDIIAHRRWMLRSYALTFAFFHVNVTYGFLIPYNELSLQSLRVFQSMISWMSNLLIIEIYIAATTHLGRFAGGKKWAKNMRMIYNPADRFYWTFKT